MNTIGTHRGLRGCVAALLALALAPAARADTEAGFARVAVTPFVETFDDTNGNGRWDQGEPYADRNGNGRFDRTWIGGYGPGRSALGIHDDLWARAMALRRNGELLVFCAVDFVGFAYDRIIGVKRRVRLARPDLAWNRLIIVSTHNHHGPDTMGLWGPLQLIPGTDVAFLDWAQDRIAEAILEALAALEPARLVPAQVAVPHVVKDIHDPKITDPNLALLAARSADGKRMLGHLWNFAAHAEILADLNRWITADYPYYLCALAERELGGQAIFFPGALGGMQTPDVKGRTFEDAQWAGEELAKAGIRALRAARPDDDEGLFAVTYRLDLPVTNLRFAVGIRAGLLGGGRIEIPEENGVLQLPSEVSYLRVGAASFVTVPGELFPETGFVLKERLPGRVKFILGLCSNEIGYIVPKDIWTPTMYEATMSLGVETEPRLKAFWLDRLGRPDAELHALEVPCDTTFPSLPELPARTTRAGVQFRHEQAWAQHAPPAAPHRRPATTGEEEF